MSVPPDILSALGGHFVRPLLLLGERTVILLAALRQAIKINDGTITICDPRALITLTHLDIAHILKMTKTSAYCPLRCPRKFCYVSKAALKFALPVLRKGIYDRVNDKINAA